MAHPLAVNEVISHFLTEFSCSERPQKTQSYILTFLKKKYSPEEADGYVSRHYALIRNTLIDEHDRRKSEKALLRFTFSDDSGERVRGIGTAWTRRMRVFQDALNQLTDSEFESLSARILQSLGCRDVWTTPTSHDQGLDSFGYSPYCDTVVPIEIHNQSKLVWLAQAKHYSKHRVGSSDIREFVGSRDLAMYKIFSTLDDRYPELTIRPFGPTAMVFITSEEIPHTVKRMGINSGIVVLTSQDIANVMISTRAIRTTRWTTRILLRAFRDLLTNIRKAV